MCKIIAIANQKGGVAKTTTTINLGVGLSKVGKRVMLIDADPQGHLTMGLGFPKNLRVTLKTMMENIIMGLEFDPREAILHHEEGIDVIPSNKLLSGMDMSLFTVEDREKVLKEYLELLENDYDYILIDCMPSLGMMTINALSAADQKMLKTMMNPKRVFNKIERSKKSTYRSRKNRLIVVGKIDFKGSEKPTSRGRKIRLIVVEKSELQRSEKSTQLILNIIILILVIRTGIILILSIFQILPNSSQWI